MDIAPMIRLMENAIMGFCKENYGSHPEYLIISVKNYVNYSAYTCYMAPASGPKSANEKIKYNGVTLIESRDVEDSEVIAVAAKFNLSAGMKFSFEAVDYEQQIRMARDENAKLKSENERLMKENADWSEECERLAKVAEFWQTKYNEQNLGWKPPKIDNL